MPHSSTDLSALVGSRICHDLISPLGAIGNGVELLELSDTTQGPEMALIAQSVDHAQARVRFFRIAFGAASLGQAISHTEVTTVLREMSHGSRVKIDWQAQGSLLRSDIRLVFLLMLCFETAMPLGGTVTINTDGPKWLLCGQSDKVMLDTNLWSVLQGVDSDVKVTAAQVQFALAAEIFASLGRTVKIDLSEKQIDLSF